MHYKKSAGSFIIFLTFFVSNVWASTSLNIQTDLIPKVDGKIKIDGVLGAKEWQQAIQIPLSYEISPGENNPATFDTTAYLLEDGEYLYVAFNALDDNPEKIRAYLSERDELWDSDYVGIALDTFNDSRRAYQFFTNAIGVQADSIIDEVNGNNDIGWDAIWESAGALHEKGYAVEMAIPLKSLRFKDNQEVKQWNIKFSRVWIRDVKYEFSNVKIDRNQDCSLCLFKPFNGFEKTLPAKNVTLIPAITLSNSKHRDINANEPWQGAGTEERGSLDARWGINQNLFLNATINPDFSHVEADEMQLEANRRFAIRTDEKRAFFLDGADYFSNWSRLVHTRLFSEPSYGLKLTGKSGDHSYGVISLKDKHTNFLLSDSQSSRGIQLFDQESENQVIRYRYDLGDKGNLGMTYTQRDSDEYSNDMLSVDGKYWLGSSNSFKFQAMTSDTINPLSIQQLHNQKAKEEGDAFSVNFTHSSRDWGIYLTHHYFGEGFRAGSGFVSRSNWKSSAFELERHWYPEDQDQWWKSITFDLQLNKTDDLDGNTLTDEKGVGIIVDGIYQSTMGFIFYNNIQNYVEQKIHSSILTDEIEALLIQNEYEIDSYEVFADVTPFAGLDISVSFYRGDEVDFYSANLGQLTTISPSASYQVNQNLKLTLAYFNNSLDVIGDTDFEEDIVNFRAAYQLNINSSIRLTLQGYKEGDYREVASQLLYSYQVDPFTLFFFGYSDDFRTTDFDQLRKTDKTLFMKFSYAWQM